jgi:hypothetical protein
MEQVDSFFLIHKAKLDRTAQNIILIGKT